MPRQVLRLVRAFDKALAVTPVAAIRGSETSDVNEVAIGDFRSDPEMILQLAMADAFCG
jgi:hypothetical protein